jgi:hypothetical protein
MTQTRNTRYPKPNKDEARQLFLAVHVKLPRELVGSRMERETYLDSVSNEMLMTSRIPQSRP